MSKAQEIHDILSELNIENDNNDMDGIILNQAMFNDVSQIFNINDQINLSNAKLDLKKDIYKNNKNNIPNLLDETLTKEKIVKTLMNSEKSKNTIIFWIIIIFTFLILFIIFLIILKITNINYKIGIITSTIIILAICIIVINIVTMIK